MRASLAVLLLMGPLAAQAQQAPWFYLDRITRQCVSVDLAFPGARGPDDVRREFVSRGLGGPWRVERHAFPAGNTAELIDQDTGRRFHFFETPLLCVGYRSLIFGR